MPLPETYYKRSGKAPIGGILLTLLFGLGSGIVLAFVYVKLIRHLPIVYLGALATLGYGILLAVAIGFGLKKGKVRNSSVATVLAGLIAVALFYFVWSVWVFDVLQRAGDQEVSLFGILTSPRDLGDLILKFNETGTWGTRRVIYSGTALWIIWAVEAGVLLLLPLLGSGLPDVLPYCETCDCWTEEGTAPREFKCVTSKDELREIVRRKDYGTLLGFPRKAGDTTFYRAKVHTCPQCRVLNVLNVEEVTLERDRYGNLNENRAQIIENLLINASEMAALQS